MTPEELEALLQRVAETAASRAVEQMQATPTCSYYDIKGAAVVVGCSAHHIRRAAIGGTLVASDVGTKNHPLYRISRENLMLWMKEREAGPKPPQRNTAPVSRHYKKPVKAAKAPA